MPRFVQPNKVLSCVRGPVTDNNGFWIGWFDLLARSFIITLITINVCLSLVPFWLDYDCLLLYSFFYWDWLGSDLRVGHLFSFRCPPVNTPQLNTKLNYWTAFWTLLWLNHSIRICLILRPTFSRPVHLRIKHPSGAYDQNFINVRQLQACWCGALSLTRGRVCRLQMPLALARAVIFGSESLGTRDHILLSQIRDFPFRRLLRLAELRWRYSTPPPHGNTLCSNFVPLITHQHGPRRKHRSSLLYPLLRAQPSALTPQKTPLSSQFVGALAAA
jgi:hypothetical protein